MYVDTNTMSVEDHFPATKTFVVDYKKISTTGTVPKRWIGFSYILSEDYELYLNFNVTEMKNKLDHSSNNKVKLFCENIGFIEEN